MSELGPEAREILRNGRNGDDPSSTDRARIHAALMATIAASAATTLASTASAAGASSAAAGAELPASVVSKSLMSSLFGSAIGKGVLVLFLGSAGMGAWWAWPEAKSNTTPSISTPTNPPAPSISVAVEPPPMVIPLEVMGEKPAPSTSGSPALVAPEKPMPAQVGPSSEGPTEAEVPSDSLVAETQRLREAHGAMRDGDPEKALALLSDQGAEAEGQKLRAERAAARVLALCKLGRVDEAQAEAAAFLAQNPRSPLADRVRAACSTPH